MTKIIDDFNFDLNDLLFPQDIKKCLICYCPLNLQNSQQFNRASCGFLLGKGKITKQTKYPRYDTKTLIGKQLHVIFILKNVLEIPSSQLEKYLRHAGDPENWFKLCDKCTQDMHHVKVIYKELQRLTAKFEEAKWQIQEKMSASGSRRNHDPPPPPPPPPQLLSKGKKGGKTANNNPAVRRPVKKEFDIVENCRFIVSQRGGNPPPLILASSPFFNGDKHARLIAGHPDPTDDDTGSDHEPQVDPIRGDNEFPSPATSSTKSAPETAEMMMVAEPEKEMAVLMKYEVETDANPPSPPPEDDDNMNMDVDSEDDHDHAEEEPDFAYALEEGEEAPKFGEDDFKFDIDGGKMSIPDEFKDGIPCPLCITQQLQFQNMGQSCRHLQCCLGTYEGRMRYFTCPICKQFKCKVKEVRAFGQHLLLCRDGQRYSETVPLEQRIFSCEVCKSKDVDCEYLQYSELLKHLYRYHQHSYACSKCPCRFETLQDCTVAHWKLKHPELMGTIPALLRFNMDPPEIPEVPWCCPMCFKKFSDEGLRDKHLDSCPEMEDQLQPDRSYKCGVKSCGKEYFWEEEVKIHEVIVHAKAHHNQNNENKLWFCDQCSKYFLTEDRMKTHSITLSLSKWLHNVMKEFSLN